MFLGATLPSYATTAFSSAASDAQLAAIAATGATWVSIVPTWYQSGQTATSIAPDGTRSATSASIGHAIDTAHGLGLKVMLKPHVDCSDGTFRGAITPSSVSAWETSYTAYLTSMASLAAAHSVDLFCAGVELNSMFAADPTYWRSLIAQVRETYSGPVFVTIYDGAPLVGTGAPVTFWDACDHLGIDAYPTLEPSSGGGTTTSVVAAWQSFLTSCAAASASTGKTVIFGEFGASSVTGGGNTSPSGTTENDADQATVYSGTASALLDTGSWLAGAFAWVWAYAAATAGSDPTGLSIAGKAAASTFSTFAEGASMTAPSTFLVTATFVDPTGAAVAGAVTFTPLARTTPSGNVVPAEPIAVTVSSSGILSRSLVAGVSYSVLEQIGTGQPISYTIPGTANIDLSTISSTVTSGLIANAYQGNWVSGNTYQQGQIVTSGVINYLALATVPAGTAVTNTTYWLALGVASASAPTSTGPGGVAGANAGSAASYAWSATYPEWDATLNSPLCALTLATPAAGTSAKARLIFRQDATGGRKVQWPSNVESIGAIPALQTAPNAVDIIELTFDDTANWVLEGAAGYSNSMDPLALTGVLICMEASSQPLLEGDTIKPSAGTVTSLFDRSPAGATFAAGSAAAATYHARGFPRGKAPASANGFSFGLRSPNLTPRAYVDLGSGGVNTGLTATVAGGSTWWVCFGFMASSVPGSGAQIVSINGSTTVQLILRSSSFAYFYDGAYHNFGSGALYNVANENGFPNVVTWWSDGSQHHIRTNGVDVTSTLSSLPTVGTLTGLQLGGDNLDAAFTDAIVCSSIPAVADMARIERWVGDHTALAL